LKSSLSHTDKTFARKQKSERQLVDINRILNSVLDLQKYELNIDGIIVDRVLAEDLPHLIGDFQQLQQVFLHLIANARHALNQTDKENKKLIVITNHTKDRIRITIEDNGVGIPPEFKTRIFDPFFSTKQIGEGTGLGLSICFGIIESHHGSLSATSKLDVGSTFTIELPVLASEKDLAKPDSELNQRVNLTVA